MAKRSSWEATFFLCPGMHAIKHVESATRRVKMETVTLQLILDKIIWKFKSISSALRNLITLMMKLLWTNIALLKSNREVLFIGDRRLLQKTNYSKSQLKLTSLMNSTIQINSKFLIAFENWKTHKSLIFHQVPFYLTARLARCFNFPFSSSFSSFFFWSSPFVLENF